jgi:hypothetical protein
MWVATLPPMAELPAHQLERLEALFRSWRERLGARTVDATRFHLLTLLFRALLKTAPRRVGRLHLAAMTAEVDKLAVQEPLYRRDWLGLCSELGMQLRPRPEWHAELRTGLRQAPPLEGEPSELLWASLRHLNGLDRELRARRAPRPLPTVRRPMPELRVVAGGRA